MMFDRGELEQLYDRYAPLAYARARRLLGDDEVAWDVVHDVFVRLAQRRSVGRDPLRYLYRATTNACIDHRRRMVHRATLPLDEALCGAADARVVDSMATRALLDTLWESLDETDRQIAVLCFVDGLTQAEIARVLGIWRRTVGRRLDRIRSRARALAEEIAS